MRDTYWVFSDIEMVPIGTELVTSSQQLKQWVLSDDHGCDRVLYSAFKDGNGIEDDFLISLYYMGNGIVEEKVTGERFYLSADFVWNEKDEETTYYDHDTTKYASEYNFLINAEKYIWELHYDNKDITIMDYAQNCYKFKKALKEYPITLNAYKLRVMTDELRKEYSKYSDTKRKKAILKLKKEAVINAKKISDAIDEEFEKATEFTSDELEMAYLEDRHPELREQKGLSRFIIK